jgi:hypothetical protein
VLCGLKCAKKKYIFRNCSELKVVSLGNTNFGDHPMSDAAQVLVVMVGLAAIAAAWFLSLAIGNGFAL